MHPAPPTKQSTRAAVALLLHGSFLWGFSRLAVRMPEARTALLLSGRILAAVAGMAILKSAWKRSTVRTPKPAAGGWHFSLWFLLLAGGVGAGQGVRALLGLLPPFADWCVSVPIPADPWQWVLTLVGSVLLPAVLEEWFFRFGLLQTLLPAGQRTAVVTAALAFAVMHTPDSFLSAFLGGLILGCFFLRFPLWQGMLLHGAVNLAAVGLSFLSSVQQAAAAGILAAMGLLALLPLRRGRPLQRQQRTPPEI